MRWAPVILHLCLAHAKELSFALVSKKMNEQLTAILAELRHYLEALYGGLLVQIVLYGSQARGDARPDSDIDVLIVLKEPFNYSHETERISFIVAPLCLEHNVVISCAFVTQADAAQLIARAEQFLEFAQQQIDSLPPPYYPPPNTVYSP